MKLKINIVIDLTWRAGYDRQQSLRALQQHQIFLDTRPLGSPYQIYNTQILCSNLNHTTVTNTFLINCKFSSENLSFFNQFQFRLKYLRTLLSHLFSLRILIYAVYAVPMMTFKLVCRYIFNKKRATQAMFEKG